MTTSVTLHTINDELRVHDVELASGLGYSRRAKLREFIKRNADELTRYGVLVTVEKAPDVEGGRPTEEYFLNEGQAIRLATLADTFGTTTVCEMVVNAYAEHRHRPPSAPSPTPDVASILSILQQMAETLVHLTKLMVPR
ncbi:hypothetical protein [Rhizobium leguminosarum]|uniref:hypothetical protein n=1 Tax=Rhizobium leguminosarum TaxID=384 RepID=UPI003F9CC6A7